MSQELASQERDDRVFVEQISTLDVATRQRIHRLVPRHSIIFQIDAPF